jgi:zinc transporter ZupT
VIPSNITFNLSYTKGVVNAIAAGSLLYAGLVEMLTEEIKDPSLEGKEWLKACLLLGFILGMSVMGVLAIWA